MTEDPSAQNLILWMLTVLHRPNERGHGYGEMTALYAASEEEARSKAKAVMGRYPDCEFESLEAFPTGFKIGNGSEYPGRLKRVMTEQGERWQPER